MDWLIDLSLCRLLACLHIFALHVLACLHVLALHVLTCFHILALVQAFFYINANVQPPHIQWDAPAAAGPTAGAVSNLPCAAPAPSSMSVPAPFSMWGAGGLGLSSWFSRLLLGGGAAGGASSALVAVPVGAVGGDMSGPSKLLGNALVGAAGSVYSIAQLMFLILDALFRIIVHKGEAPPHSTSCQIMCSTSCQPHRVSCARHCLSPPPQPIFASSSYWIGLAFSLRRMPDGSDVAHDWTGLVIGQGACAVGLMC